MKMSFFEKIFNKTVLLRPTPEGVLEPMDITGQDQVFLSQKDIMGNARAVEIYPPRIYAVRGMGKIKRICIHQYDSTQLLDLYKPTTTPQLSENMLAVLQDISYHKGLMEGSAGGAMNEGLAKYLKMIMVLCALCALLLVGIVFKVF